MFTKVNDVRAQIFYLAVQLNILNGSYSKPLINVVLSKMKKSVLVMK